MTDLLSELRALCDEWKRCGEEAATREKLRKPYRKPIANIDDADADDVTAIVIDTIIPEIRAILDKVPKDAVCVILSPDDVNAIESALALREYRMRKITFAPGLAEEKALTDPLRRIVAEARHDR